MTSDALDLALYAAWRSRAITCTELRILDTIQQATNGDMAALSYQQLATLAGLAVRTLTRHMESLIMRGYLLMRPGQPGKANEWGVDQDPAHWGQPSKPMSPATPGNCDHSHERPHATVTIVTDNQGHSDPYPADRIPMPQTPPAAPTPRARVFNTSSSSSFNLNDYSNDDDGRGARANVVAGFVELGLERSQAEAAVRANPRLTLDDVAAWRAWLEVSQARSPVGVMVARLQRGEPVPVIYARRPDQGVRRGPPMSEAPGVTVEEAKRLGDARTRAALAGIPGLVWAT